MAGVFVAILAVAAVAARFFVAAAAAAATGRFFVAAKLLRNLRAIAIAMARTICKTHFCPCRDYAVEPA